MLFAQELDQYRTENTWSFPTLNIHVLLSLCIISTVKQLKPLDRALNDEHFDTKHIFLKYGVTTQ